MTARLFARLAARLLFTLCAVLPLTLDAAPAGTVPLSAFPRERIAVETRASFRRHLFEAWRAATPQTREQGFMFVEDSAVRPDQAMIFTYDPPAHVAMWMKNTLLPLDMLFVDQRGCVVTIKQNAKPGSLATIESRLPVSLVVELKAGTIAAQGIAVGDRVLRLDAGWPPTEQSCTKAGG
ncbi:MAG: DUF192 domain-containing protein [Steroidobacteraceae bacterium]